MFGIAFDLFLQDVKSTPFPLPSFSNPKCLQTLPTRPSRQNHPLLGTIGPEQHSQPKLADSLE